MRDEYFTVRRHSRYAVVGDTAGYGLASSPSGETTHGLRRAGRPDALMFEVAEQQIPQLRPGTRVIVAAGTQEVIEGLRDHLDGYALRETVTKGLKLILNAAARQGTPITHIVGPINPALKGHYDEMLNDYARSADRAMARVAARAGVSYISTFRNEAELRRQMRAGADVYSALRNVVAGTPVNTAPRYTEYGPPRFGRRDGDYDGGPRYFGERHYHFRPLPPEARLLITGANLVAGLLAMKDEKKHHPPQHPYHHPRHTN